jgi:glutathione S-transferase
MEMPGAQVEWRMVVLYHCVSARSFRPLWMLEELGAPYELRMLPFPPRLHQRSYLELNPLGTIPLLIDGDTRMTESAAICQYLAERFDPQNIKGLAVRPNEPGFGAWLNGLHQGEATLTFPQTIVLRYGHFEPDERKLPQAAADYTKWFLSRLRWIDAVLQDNEFLCAGRFTAADISVAYALMLAGQLGLQAQMPDAVNAYWARLQQREGFRRALAAQHEAALAQGISPQAAAID